MTELARFHPLRRCARLGIPALFDDWFRESGMQPFWREPELAADMRADVSEDDKEIVAKRYYGRACRSSRCRPTSTASVRRRVTTRACSGRPTATPAASR